MSSVASRILGTGSYVPEQRLTNADLEKLVDTSDAWIRERTGIGERRVAAKEQASSDLAFEAAKHALEAAGLTAADLDMIIVGTVTPDMPTPSCAAFLQRKLGVLGIPAFDISAACAGFVYGLSIADQFVKSGQCRHVLVVGVELLSRVINWEDRATCVLFGDGAGAVVVGRATEEEPGRLLSTSLHTDATLADSLCIPAGGSREPLTEAGIADHRNTVHMVGSDIFRVAVRNLTQASRNALEKGGLTAADVAWVVPHQANLRIIAQVAQRLEIPLDRFVLNIERYGNTSSASIPLALDEAIRDGRIRKGDTVLMCALGAGISWASALARL